MSTDLKNGRNGSHQYNAHFAPPAPPVKLKKDGTPYKVQPKRPKPRFDVPGVTTIVSLLEKPGLEWAAARETALLAVYGADKWRHLPDDLAVEKLRRYFRRLWDIKADTGNIVHDVALAWAQGKDADLAQLMAVDRQGNERDWDEDERKEALRRATGCIDALELFYLEQRPQWRYVEQTILHPYAGYSPDKPYRVDPKTSYMGCFDADGELAEYGPGLWDFKTGKRYLTEVTLQVAGYGHAPLLAFHDDEGYLERTEPYDAPAQRGVIYLNDDGTYEVLPLPADRSAYVRFMQLRRHHAWLKSMREWEKAHPSPAEIAEIQAELLAAAVVDAALAA